MQMDPCELSPSYVRSIAPYQPGKPISELARELGLKEENIVKLASNENPRGIGPRTRAAIEAALGEIARYPDGNGHDLKTALSRRYGVDTGAIIAQQTVPVLDDDTAESLHARIQVAEHELYPAAIRSLADGRVQVRGRRVVARV